MATRVDDSLTLPADLPPGSYDLVLTMRDPAGYREPLALAIAGVRGDSSYQLGEMVVRDADSRLSEALLLPRRVYLPMLASP